MGFSLNPDGTLIFHTTHGNRICLPANKLWETLNTAHEVLGHFGHAKTHTRAMDTFYRPGLATAVAEYVRHCPECSVNKLHNTRMVGEFGRIDSEIIPEAFEAVNIDIIVNLLRCEGHDAIMVVIDRFTTSTRSLLSAGGVVMAAVVERTLASTKTFLCIDHEPLWEADVY
jgi:hypothetical protein